MRRSTLIPIRRVLGPSLIAAFATMGLACAADSGTGDETLVPTGIASSSSSSAEVAPPDCAPDCSPETEPPDTDRLPPATDTSSNPNSQEAAGTTDSTPTSTDATGTSSNQGEAGFTDGPPPTGVPDPSSSQSTTTPAGCGTESFRAIYQDIFANPTHSCTAPSCHGRTIRLEDVGNLDLSSVEIAYGELVGIGSDSDMCAGKTRVVPGDPQGSLLVAKLRDATVECGLLMPVGAPIDDASLMRITDWIGAGACDN